MGVISSGLSRAGDEELQFGGRRNSTREGSGGEMEIKQQEIEFSLERQVEISTVGKGGRLGSWSIKMAEEEAVGGLLCAKSLQCRDCEGWKGRNRTENAA